MSYGSTDVPQGVHDLSAWRQQSSTTPSKTPRYGRFFVLTTVLAVGAVVAYATVNSEDKLLTKSEVPESEDNFVYGEAELVDLKHGRHKRKGKSHHKGRSKGRSHGRRSRRRSEETESVESTATTNSTESCNADFTMCGGDEWVGTDQCCTDDLTCYKKNESYSECTKSCPKYEGWSCEKSDSTLHATDVYSYSYTTSSESELDFTDVALADDE